MLPSSHSSPMNALAESLSIPGNDLTDAFAAFIAAANRLERSHLELHNEVADLRGELEQRNRELAASSAETERMRLALSNILEQLPCGVLVVDRQKREVILSNPEVCRVLQIPLLPTLTWERLPGTVQEAICALNEIAASSNELEMRIGNETKETWLALRYVAMLGSDAPCAKEQGILILRDVSVQKQVEREREAVRRMVSLAEVATMLAHEIRNPLGSMELMADLLTRDKRLTNEPARWARSLQAGVRSLSATVNNVLSFHNMGALPLQPIQIGEALRSALDFVRPLIEEAEVALEAHCETGAAKINGNVAAIQQIILNLTCNALRHASWGKQLKIEATVENVAPSPTVVVAITDSGKGIPFKSVEKLFTPGFSTASQGPGLGLAICRQIVEQHRGVITACSGLRGGAMFRLEFPVL